MDIATPFWLTPRFLLNLKPPMFGAGNIQSSQLRSSLSSRTWKPHRSYATSNIDRFWPSKGMVSTRFNSPIAGAWEASERSWQFWKITSCHSPSNIAPPKKTIYCTILVEKYVSIFFGGSHIMPYLTRNHLSHSSFLRHIPRVPSAVLPHRDISVLMEICVFRVSQTS